MNWNDKFAFLSSGHIDFIPLMKVSCNRAVPSCHISSFLFHPSSHDFYIVFKKAASPASVLNAIPLSNLDGPAQAQVTAFLNKISAFPTKMSAVKITTISTTFLASVSYYTTSPHHCLSIHQTNQPFHSSISLFEFEPPQ